MSLNAAERAELRASWQRMGPAEKLRYIWLYYKWYILLLLLAVGITVSTAHRLLTQKQPLLYLGLVNVAPADEMMTELSDGFIATLPDVSPRASVDLYQGLYLSDDASTANHEYAYASRLKVLATITDQKLDVVLMNREGYDIFSANGYLLPLPDLLAQDAELSAALAPRLVENTVILSDNSIEVELNEAEEYVAETEQAVNGIDASDFPLFAQAGFSDKVYLGVIGNTPRSETVLRYFAYLAGL